MSERRPSEWIPPSFDDWSGSDERAGETARLSDLSRYLHERAPKALRQLSASDLVGAWAGARQAFADPGSPQRCALDSRLRHSSGLSQGCLDASLATLLAGFSDDSITAVVERAERLGAAQPVLLILASNLPGLVLQPLLCSLARRTPMLIKCGSGESEFTPAFIADLAARQPAIGDAVAAVTWSGGEPDIESAIFEHWRTILAFGGSAALGDLERRLGGRLLAFGPKASLAVISEAGPEDLESVASAVARDIALFDQRGCLSVQAIYTEGRGGELAAALASALERLADDWPMELEIAELAMLRQCREQALAEGAEVLDLPIRAGTVVLDSNPAFRPSPGFRSVRVQPLPDLARLPDILAKERGRLQGVSLSGNVDPRLLAALEALGVSRIAACGELQSAPADWHNDGVDLVAAIG